MATIDFDSPPDQIIDYFKSKKPELHFDYDEIMHSAHNKAFTVAKITRLDLVSDIQESLISAMKNGEDFKTWKKNITPTLEQKGWFGKTEVMNPSTGEFKKITVGSKRLKTIYDTNMRTSYAQGRYYSQMQSSAQYLRYVAVLDYKVRPSHRVHHGIILPKDDPWWDTNYPPNGWNCRCRAMSVFVDDLERRGWSVSKSSLPNIADKDWAYHPGKTDNTMKAYQEKLDSLKQNCKGINARGNKPCMDKLYKIAKQEFEKDKKILKERLATFVAIKELFTTTAKKEVELCKSDMFGEQKRVLLSSDTVGSHGHHPEIGAFEYSLIPQMLDGRVFAQEENTYIIIKKLGRYYRVSLKNIKDKDEIYIKNLIRANSKSRYQKWLKELSKYKEVLK